MNSILISTFLLISLAGCAQKLVKDILIVYLSTTNNTKAVAEMIHEKVGVIKN